MPDDILGQVAAQGYLMIYANNDVDAVKQADAMVTERLGRTGTHQHSIVPRTIRYSKIQHDDCFCNAPVTSVSSMIPKNNAARKDRQPHHDQLIPG